MTRALAALLIVAVLSSCMALVGKCERRILIETICEAGAALP